MRTFFSIILWAAYAVADGVGWLWRRLFPHNPWKQFHSSTDVRPDSTVKLYYALREAGIRCKYRNVGMPAVGAGSSGVGISLVLLVHEDDVPMARVLAAGLRVRG